MGQRIKNQIKSTIRCVHSFSGILLNLNFPTSTFITKFPIVVGKDTILVIYNRLSKITHFVTVIKDILAKELARLFRNNI